MADSRRGAEEDRPDLPDPASLPEIPEAPDVAPERAPRETDDRSAASAPGRARRAALIGLRTATGLIGTAAAVATLAAIGLLPFPNLAAGVRGVEITPQAADLALLCPGAILRLGDDSGADAATPSAIGTAVVRSGTVDTEVESADLDGTPGVPRVLTAPPSDGALLAGAQSQTVDRSRFSGFAAASCREAASSTWLVGGATTTGRTTLVNLSNPGTVEATVELAIWGESGPIAAPGLGGISVPPGTQRVLSLAGFTQGLASPVVQVDSRGGQVVASLQQSTLRAVDPGGSEIVGESAAPSTRTIIPGVRIVDGLPTAEAVSREGYDDLVTQLRLLAPGTEDATATVSLERDDGQPVGGTGPEDGDTTGDQPGDAGTDDAGAGDSGAGSGADDAADASGQSFEVQLTAGASQDVDLQDLADGVYTVSIDSDRPVVGAVRAATATAVSGTDALEAPVNDFAWFGSATPLAGSSLVTIASGPDPLLTFANPGDYDADVVVSSDGIPTSVTVPARGSASLPVGAAATYELTGAGGLVASVGFAGAGQLSGYTVSPTRPVSGSIVVRP